jgi:hypothetical protein
MLKWLLAAVGLYGGFVALVYVVQRSLQYFPERQRTAPSAAGLPEAEEAVLDTADGERVIVWHVLPRGGKPIFLYFRTALLRCATSGASGAIMARYNTRAPHWRRQGGSS